MIRSNFPCKGCTDRKVGCHASCEKYISAKAEYDRKVELIRQGAILDAEVNDYIANMKARRCKCYYKTKRIIGER